MVSTRLSIEVDIRVHLSHVRILYLFFSILSFDHDIVDISVLLFLLFLPIQFNTQFARLYEQMAL